MGTMRRFQKSATKSTICIWLKSTNNVKYKRTSGFFKMFLTDRLVKEIVSEKVSLAVDVKPQIIMIRALRMHIEDSFARYHKKQL